MKAAVACRRQIVDAMLDEVVDALCAAANAQFVRDKTSKARYRIEAGAVSARWDVIAIGSSNPTSDYDVSFNFSGDSPRETEAVARFNQRFIDRFGAPSGEFFDTNAYTVGFMTSIEGIKVSKPRVGAPFDGLRRHKAEIDELQLALSLAPVRQYRGARWPDALQAMQAGGHGLRRVVREPIASPARSPARCPGAAPVEAFARRTSHRGRIGNPPVREDRQYAAEGGDLRGPARDLGGAAGRCSGRVQPGSRRHPRRPAGNLRARSPVSR